MEDKMEEKTSEIERETKRNQANIVDKLKPNFKRSQAESSQH
jgi:hypothetical protein